MKNQPYKIKSITESLRDDVLAQKITLREAAVELHCSGWSTFIDIDKTRRLLKLDFIPEEQPARPTAQAAAGASPAAPHAGADAHGFISCPHENDNLDKREVQHVYNFI